MLSIGVIPFGPSVSVPPNNRMSWPLDDDLPDDLAERERHDPDVGPAQAQGRDPDEHAGGRRHDHREDQDEQEVDVDPRHPRRGLTDENRDPVPPAASAQ